MEIGRERERENMTTPFFSLHTFLPFYLRFPPLFAPATQANRWSTDRWSTVAAAVTLDGTN